MCWGVQYPVVVWGSHPSFRYYSPEKEMKCPLGLLSRSEVMSNTISSTIVSGCPDIPSNILEELWCCETDPHVGPGLHTAVWLICIFHCVAGDQITLQLKMVSSALFNTQRINNLKPSHGHTGFTNVSVKAAPEALCTPPLQQRSIKQGIFRRVDLQSFEREVFLFVQMNTSLTAACLTSVNYTDLVQDISPVSNGFPLDSWLHEKNSPQQHDSKKNYNLQ